MKKTKFKKRKRNPNIYLSLQEMKLLYDICTEKAQDIIEDLNYNHEFNCCNCHEFYRYQLYCDYANISEKLEDVIFPKRKYTNKVEEDLPF